MKESRVLLESQSKVKKQLPYEEFLEKQYGIRQAKRGIGDSKNVKTDYQESFVESSQQSKNLVQGSNWQRIETIPISLFSQEPVEETKAIIKKKRKYSFASDSQTDSDMQVKQDAGSDTKNHSQNIEIQTRKRHDSDHISESDDLEQTNANIKKQFAEALGDEAMIEPDSDLEVERPRNVEKEAKYAVFRDAQGNPISNTIPSTNPNNLSQDVLLQLLGSHEIVSREQLQKLNEEQIATWSQGLAQREAAVKRLNQLQEIQGQPFAQYGLSKESELALIAKDRFGDPMAQFSTEKQQSVKKAFVSKFPPIPNRFNILPGFMWDGVDRSNNYEARHMSQINERQARDKVAYTEIMKEL